MSHPQVVLGPTAQQPIADQTVSVAFRSRCGATYAPWGTRRSALLKPAQIGKVSGFQSADCCCAHRCTFADTALDPWSSDDQRHACAELPTKWKTLATESVSQNPAYGRSRGSYHHLGCNPCTKRQSGLHLKTLTHSPIGKFLQTNRTGSE